MGVTIYDVAAAARVSPATVSRVLGGGAAVAPQTAARVRDVIERLGYRPDRVAQALRRQRSAMVGLILPMAEYPASTALLQGLERALARRDVSLVVADNGSDEADAGSRLVSQGIDALLLVRTRPGPALIEAAEREQVPLILVDSGPGGQAADAVRTDHAAGMRQVIRLVVKEGAGTLAFLGSGTATIIGMEQLDGFTEASVALEEDVLTVLRIGPGTREFGRTTAEELMTRNQPPDAYVCGSDVVACAVCATLEDAGVSERPLVTGYGGDSWTELVRPALTTVRIPATEVAEEAVRLVTRRLDGLAADPIDIVLPPTLLVRETT